MDKTKSEDNANQENGTRLLDPPREGQAKEVEASIRRWDPGLSYLSSSLYVGDIGVIDLRFVIIAADRSLYYC